MHLALRTVVTLALLGVLVGPVWGDVIPSRYAEKSDSKAKVEARLTELGVASADAKSSTRQLSEAQAAYFADSPDRVQVVGQEIFGGQSDNLWWEWIGGIATLGGVAFGYYIFAISNDD
jgi:hypothetical protein